MAGCKVVKNQIPEALILYEDGSIDRFSSPVPVLPASALFVNGVATKDVCINPSKATWARIFLPHIDHGRLAPLVLHFHGGGMCIGSPAEPIFHNFCSRMASKSRSIWISVAYRLAPEYRLPAQYEDCFEALRWLQSQFTSKKQHDDVVAPVSTETGRREAWEIQHGELSRVFCSGEKEPWLIEYGDATKVFCTGESAGATILHFVTLQLSKQEWSPLHVRGLMFVDIGVMTDPLPDMKPLTDPSVTTKMLAASVDFCLPDELKLGDPLLDCLHSDLKHLLQLPWPPALVLVADQDLLYESGMDYFNALMQAGKVVELHKSQGYGHCFHLRKVDSEEAELREKRMVEFIQKF